MTLRSRKIDQPPLGQQIEPLAIPQRELFHVFPNGAPLLRQGSKSFEVDLHIKVAGIAQDGTIPHPLEVLPA